MRVSINKLKNIDINELAFILTVLEKYKKKKGIPNLYDLSDQKWHSCKDINLLIYHTIISKAISD